MTRSPLFYPLNRGMDAEAGGAADLQTDVMRFMAILSLCLVAIFALVQSIPMAPSNEEPTPVEQTAEVESVETLAEQPVPPTAEATVTQAINLTRPPPQKLPVKELSPVLQRPVARAMPVESKPATPGKQVTGEPPTEATAPNDGFTLRFEDDTALTRLVARNEVALYAMFPDESLRMNLDRGQVSFRAASNPEQFHEMDASTVPQPVLDAFQRGDGPRGRELQWGVTIPAATARQLDQFLRDASGGTLIIDADGDLRLEP